MLLEWHNDVTVMEQSGQYEVRLSARALAEMRTEARRGRRVRGERVETGGMLPGSIDEATQTVFIDTATGPSPDSRLSASYFDHGTQGTQQVVTRTRELTVDRVGFVGMWHSHPYGLAAPSPTDENGMADVVTLGGTSRRALMVILGGSTNRWRSWLDSGTPPAIYARVVTRTTAHRPAAGSATFLSLAATWFPGGYAYPAPSPTDRHGRILKDRGK